MESSAQKTPITFPCSGCGGQMFFNTEGQNLKCQYCGKEESIEDSKQRPIEYALNLSDSDSDADLGARSDWGFRKQTIHCENCGGESVISELETSTLCAFCGSPKVLRQEDKASIRPETIIPFLVTMDQAVNSFKLWKKKRWFVPNAFKKGNIVSRLTGIYIPYWTFDSQTASVYTAQRGDYHYRTETRTRVVNGKSETYTTQVRYTVWHNVGGGHNRFFDDILIPASSRYDGDMLDKLGNFNLKQLKEYKPEYLSGYTAERYSISRKDGWRSAGQEIDAAVRSDIIHNIGGDEVRALHIRTQYYNNTYKHILLPLWNANYSYRNKPYRYMVNGQTGLVSGTVPRSPWKISFFVLFCLIAAAVIIFFVMQNN